MRYCSPCKPKELYVISYPIERQTDMKYYVLSLDILHNLMKYREVMEMLWVAVLAPKMYCEMKMSQEKGTWQIWV